MAQLYHHRQFRLYSDFRAVNREARFSGGKTTDQMYFLRDKNGATVDVALDYFAFLILVRNLKKVGSEANAIKRFWNFLEENDMRWDEMPAEQSARPTYAYYRTLREQLHNGTIVKSTASKYMRSVINFYKFAMAKRLCEFSDDRLPFDAYTKTVTTKSGLNYVVDTTDLKFNGFTNKKPSLSAMEEESQEEFERALQHQKPVFKMLCQLGYRAGLRISEATSLTISAIETARQSPKRPGYIEIDIGPRVGMNTKFSNPRVIELPLNLFKAIKRYITSREHMLLRSKLKQKHEHCPVFITRRGTPYNPHTLYAHWYRFKEAVSSKFKFGFNFRFHDLRATFSLNFMKSDELSPLGEEHKASYLQDLLGHTSGFTTYLYFLQINTDTVKIRNINRKEQFMNENCSHLRVTNAW